LSEALPVVSGRQTIKALRRLGFEQVSQRGSHVKLRRDIEP
jgi:predicted RNA binding protein YcfA (HicA-like mRNA interferase family)